MSPQYGVACSGGSGIQQAVGQRQTRLQPAAFPLGKGRQRSEQLGLEVRAQQNDRKKVLRSSRAKWKKPLCRNVLGDQEQKTGRGTAGPRGTG